MSQNVPCRPAVFESRKATGWLSCQTFQIFLVFLPRPAIQFRHRLHISRLGCSSMGAAQSNGLRVLVVEDNIDTADSLALLLELRGNHVQVARCGADAVTAAGEA